MAGHVGDGSLTILGGGPAGLGVALYGHRAGIPFVLFERSGAVGGLCRTVRWGAHRYDTGAHRFHDRDPDITRDVRELMGEELVAVDAPSQIHHRGRWLDFPPTPVSWLLGQGPVEAARAVADLIACRRRPRPERSFEDRAVNRYGRRLGRPLLIEYSEKLWGLPADQLSPEVATRRLPGLGLQGLIADLLPGRSAAHLDGTFLYPLDGYGALADRMAASLPPAAVRLEHDVVGLECAQRRIRAVHFADGGAAAVRGRVVSTLPLPLLVPMLGGALPDAARQAAARLRFRHVRLVVLRLAVARCSRNATVYLPARGLAASRLVEPKNRSPRMAPAHETSLVAEVPCGGDEPLSALPDDALAARVVSELAAVGLVDGNRVLDWRHHRLRNAYPVYAIDFAHTVEEVLGAIASIENLDTLGRGGMFWYSHLHDQLRLAKDYVGRPRPAQRRAAACTMPAHMTASASRL